MLICQEIGSLRKPAWLVSILRNRRATKEQKEEARDDAALLNIRMLEKVGLDLVYDGEARRVEMYEYPIRRTRGFRFCGRIRSFDNRYYRKARCIDKVAYLSNYHLEELLFVKKHAGRGVKIPVTGAYTLADWSYNEYYTTKEEFTLDLAREVMRPLLRDLASAGADWVQIDEPAATTHPKEMPLFVEAFNEAVKGIGCNISVHICYSGDNYRSLFPHVLEMKTKQFALEFANRDSRLLGLDDSARGGYSALKLFREYGEKRVIGLGVVDVHVDDIESKELIRDRILYAAKILDDPGQIHVNPDCGLRTRSRAVAFRKLENLVEGARLAKGEFEVA